MDGSIFFVLALISLFSTSLTITTVQSSRQEPGPEVSKISTNLQGRAFGMDKDPEKHGQFLILILEYIDKKLDEIFDSISKRKQHGENCTYEIDM